MAAYQATNIPSISLPNGSSHLPLQVLPWLEHIRKIYLWLDEDFAGTEASAKFSQKLGHKRCLLVKPSQVVNVSPPKDANDALLNNEEHIPQILHHAKSIQQQNLTSFQEMREEVRGRILRELKETGIMSDFKWFNEKTKGFRRGELTLLTGATGAGKTTLLSQLSLDLLKRAVPTLWGSFEIKNDLLLRTMLCQFAQVNLIQQPELFDEYADEFQLLPLHLLKLFGSSDVDKVLDTMDYAVYAYDVAHIIIDNLQFMISGQTFGMNKFDLQDEIISKLRTFSTDKNVHITLVIHPKKVDDDQDINISSIFGTAKATQEADNIFVIQNRNKYRLIDVRKNRYDGTLGRQGLVFHKDTKTFIELSREELVALVKEEVSIDTIVDQRKKIFDKDVEEEQKQ